MNEEYKKMIGSHIAKEKTFFKTLSAPSTLPLIEGGCPIQIFTGSNRSWALPQSDPQDVRETRTWVEEKGVTLFIHSIYLINLSRCGPDFSKARDRLIHDLVLGPQLGAKGVVVHVGKALQMGQPQAILNMYNNLVGLLDHIDPSCPLLVETPAGQGTEILVSLDSFKKFYARFTPQQMEKIKVCIDTCHVWAAGHEPLEYLEGWTQTFPGSSNSEGVGADRTPSGVRYRSVEDGQGAKQGFARSSVTRARRVLDARSLALVHYNDSKTPKGSRRDRHEVPGEGHIGKEKMDRIVEWCTAAEVPMVVE